MPLHLITGPPNSGRTERLRELFVQAERKGPVLVVPSVGDIFAWERRLTEPDGAFIGARVFHFRDLCVEIIKRSGGRRKAPVSEFRRRQMMADVVHAVWPEQVERLRDQPGFLDSLLDLVDDLRSEEILTAEELQERIREAGIPGLGPIGPVFEGYLERLDRSGGTDMPGLISNAVRLLPDAWESGSPLFMAGFDDLTGQQREMVRRLAVGERGVDVTIAVTHEPDNPGTAISNELVAVLREIGGATEMTEEQFERDETGGDVSPLLHRLTGRFLRPPVAGEALLEPDPSLTLIEAAGTRNEAEAIGSEVARLIDSGVEPGRVGIAVASPGAEGRLIRDVLERYEVPVALEAEIPAGSTLIGSAIAALIRAITRDSIDDLLFWLRAPSGTDPETVDLLELYCVKDSESSARGAVARFEKIRGEVPGWLEMVAKLESNDSVTETIEEITDLLVAGTLASDASRPPSEGTVLEMKVAGALRRALEELSELESDGQRQIEALLDAIDSGAIKVWSSPSGGAVTIASPYGMRGKRFDHLFMAGLQEAGSRDPERPSPFLSRQNRNDLGMSVRVDQDYQDRYLFYSCLNVPTERLWLTFTTSDETGKSTRPSPLVKAVELMFDGPLDRILRNGRTPVFGVDATPTVRELARSAASGSPLPDSPPESVDLSWLEDALTKASSAVERTGVLGSLENPELIETLAGDGVLSPTGVEAWVQCPYRWYVQKAVRPDEFGPRSEPLVLGTALHEVLRRLYEKRSGSRPADSDLQSWLGDLDSCLDEVFAEPRYGVSGSDVRSEVLRLRMRHMTREFIRKESEHPLGDLMPTFLEHEFGPIEMEGPVPWKLKGKIDRIDLGKPDEEHEGGRALVIDYKSGSITKYQKAKAIENGTIQLILYLAAVEGLDELAGADPIGGLYLPISSDKARGALGPDLYPMAASWHFIKNDAQGDLDSWIGEGLVLAGQGAAGVLEGVLEHDPVTCRDHFEHAAVPDWSPDEGDDRKKGED